MLHLRWQLGDGTAAGVGANPVEGALLCTLGADWCCWAGCLGR